QGFYEYEPFMRYIAKDKPDLIILDLMLPGKDGLDICKELKTCTQFKNIPIIMLTAKSEETDKIIGLELGADDYVTKPFSVKELTTRVKVIIKRYSKEVREGETSKIIKVGSEIIIDKNKMKLTIKNKVIELTKAEFNLFLLFASRPDHVFTRDAILNYLWGDDKIVTDRSVDVHVRHLRDKLGSKYGSKIKNVRGVGYKLEV
ncbi:winged helix-turn-helix domain-containing protein, partial [bacterium]